MMMKRRKRKRKKKMTNTTLFFGTVIRSARHQNKKYKFCLQLVYKKHK
jgi:hypothetical protein